MFKIDSFSSIGHKHNICEDYIIHGYINNKTPYIILSDGCSSSKNTDIGARLLVHSAKKILLNCDLKNIDYDYIGNAITSNAMVSVLTLGLSLECLDATLIIMFVCDDKIYILRYGDGSIILNYKEEEQIQIKSFEYLSNTPYYLSIKNNSDSKDIYFKTVGDYYNVKTLNYSNDTYPCKIINDDILIYDLDETHIESIFVSSDGIDSFINNVSGEKIEAIDVITQLCTIQNTNGNYIKRTMKSKKGILNKYKKENIFNYDDISIGCIKFEG